MDIKKSIGYNIKKLREEKGLKQSTLASQLSVSVQTLSTIENGKKDLKLSQIEKIASCLNVSIIDLLEYGNNKISQADKLSLSEKVLKIAEMNNALLDHSNFEVHEHTNKLLANQEAIKKILEEILAGRG
jgi:transcriptional regulator with XRE-family HTH domain